MTEDEYRQLSALNHSTFKAFFRSPHAYKNQKPVEQSEAMRIGLAVHTLWLEGTEKFTEQYAIYPDIDGRTKEGKEMKRIFDDQSQNKTKITHESGEIVYACVNALNNSNVCSKHFMEGSDIEKEVVLTAKLNGILCKGRIDAISLKESTIWDVKTCEDASFTEFRRDILNRNYHTQAAFYTMLADEVYGKRDWNYKLIAVEKKRENGVHVFSLGRNVIEASRNITSLALEQLKICEQTGYFPDFGESEVNSLYGITA